MKTPNRTIAFIFALMLLNGAACNRLSQPPTETPTPVPTNTTAPTSTATNTATPRPTSTSRPTATAIPFTATAVPMGSPAINDQYEVNVLYARFFSKISSQGFIYTPSTPGGKFLDLAVVVKNLQPGQQKKVSWRKVYIVDKNNKGWYPNFGGSFAPNNNEKFDPTTLFLYPQGSLDPLVFDAYPLYLRGVWATDGQRPATFLFGFDTSNVVEVVIP